MKKIISIIVAIIILLGILIIAFYPCIIGNKQLVDLHQDYDYAIIQRYDGEQKIEIASWKDYDGEQIQITDINGNTYLVNSVNIILIKEGN